MKNSVLIELAKKWEYEAITPETQNGSPDAAIGNAEANGRRKGLSECAKELRMLVDLLGNKKKDDRFAPVIKRSDVY